MRRKSYPSDISTEEWQKLQPLLPRSKRGAPRRVNMREIINALRYLNRTGCQWRMLPHDLPSWEKVYYYFSEWRDSGDWERINRELRIEIRVSVGKDPEPSAAILDSQSVKATEVSGSRGYDAGKKIKGIKRHLLVDTLGMVLAVMILTADIQDRDDARQLLEKIKARFPRLKQIWADGGSAGTLIDWVKQLSGWVLEIVKRSDTAKGFQVLPHRWIVERTFGWFNRYRRLSKHYEALASSGEAMIYIATITLMTKRLTNPQTRFA